MSTDKLPSAVPKYKRPQPKGGSRKGIPNKLPGAAKESIALAAEGLGGTARLIEWAKSDPRNEHAFWVSVYPKLLPLQVGGIDGEAIALSLNVSFR